jgi:hypothetical protein
MLLLFPYGEDQVSFFLVDPISIFEEFFSAALSGNSEEGRRERAGPRLAVSIVLRAGMALDFLKSRIAQGCSEGNTRAWRRRVCVPLN